MTPPAPEFTVPDTGKPLPGLRIMPLIDSTYDQETLTGQYVLVTNWDPMDESFTLKDKSLLENGEHGKHVTSWKEAYNAAFAAIGKIEELIYRKALLRGLTPIPLKMLFASVVTQPCGESDIVGAQYQWQFLGSGGSDFDVFVHEPRNCFFGTHDTR